MNDLDVPGSVVAGAQSASGLTAESTISEWLSDPVGGQIFRSLLAESGQKESALQSVRNISLAKLASLSNGQMTDAMVEDMVEKAHSGTVSVESSAAPQSHEASTAPAPHAWEERIVPGRFLGKTVIVTGAGSGIGQATASRVAREGGHVIAVDISSERLSEFMDEFHEYSVDIVPGDIREASLIREVCEHAGPVIDCLANVAGIMDNFTPLHEMPDEVWDRVLGVNLEGMMRLSRAVLPVMLKQGYGSIVNVGSEASIKGSAAGVAYTTSKHAVAGLSKSMAFMYGPQGIRTNVVAPGGVLTNIEARFESEMGTERVNQILATMPGVAPAEQLAALISYLLSDDSANINGAVIPSDGGWSVQ